MRKLYEIYVPLEFVKTIQAESPEAAQAAVEKLVEQWRIGDVSIRISDHVFYAPGDVEVNPCGTRD